MNFKAFFSNLWKSAQPTVEALSGKVGQALLLIAEQGVLEALSNNSLKTPEARRAYVFQKLKDSDLSTNNAVADTVISIAVEAAFKKYGH